MERRRSTAFALGLSLLSTTAPAQTPEGDVAAFFRLRREATAAAQAADPVTAAARLAEADARVPDHPGLTLMRARAAMALDRPEDAAALVARYADYGLTADLDRDRVLATLPDSNVLTAARARLAANAAPVGADRLTAVFEVAGDGLTEAVVRDAQRDRWLVSQVRGRTVLVVDPAGATRPLVTSDADIGGVLGLALSPDGETLWAATAPLTPALAALPGDAPKPVSALLRIAAADGRILQRYPLTAEAALGDLALGPDGTVYVSDAVGAAVYRLRPGARALEALVPPGALGSPQGLAVTPGGDALIVADYSSGLWRVDLADGNVRRVAAPGESLIGIDGLMLDGARLYAIQNGTRPQRVLRLGLDAGWTRVEVLDVVAANLPELDEPTTGSVLDGELVFVARSQWSDFDAEGAPRTADMAPARIVRLKLD